jgi:hypothetical protein
MKIYQNAKNQHWISNIKYQQMVPWKNPKHNQSTLYTYMIHPYLNTFFFVVFLHNP